MNRHSLATGYILLVLFLFTACVGDDKEKSHPTATPSRLTEATTQQVEPQSEALMLRITSPEINLITELNQVTVSGVTSPDATLSVNGRLVFPNHKGMFSIDLDFSNTAVPMIIEVIASSITGETKSEIRPVISSSGSGLSGIFGTVSSVAPSNITLNTASSLVSLSVDDETSVAIHGRESPSVSDITIGTLVGVMRQGAQAKYILTVPIRPILTRHFTGVATASKESALSTSNMRRITLLDYSKRKITVSTTDEMADDAIGSLVTAVLEQDISSGDLKAIAINPALDSADRILNALAINQGIESDQAAENVTALRWRLSEHGVRNVSMLLDQQPYEEWEDELTSAEKTYTRLFAKHHIGSPSADVTGLITSIATSLGSNHTKLITVQPKLGEPVMVKLSDNTPIVLSSDRIKSGQLDLASKITVRYSIEGNDAIQVKVLSGNTLSPESSVQLAAIAGQGEVQGLLMSVINSESESVVSILVDAETGQQISLRSDEALIFHNGVPVELDPSLEGSNVYARYDPATYRLLEIESFNLAKGEDLVSGVVDSFIPKFANGNLTIRTIDGQMRALTHHTDTVIRRDGLRVSIHDVRLGDLVRPSTKIRTSQGVEEVLSLSLKTPEPGRTSGFIRGITPGPGGQAQLTISNIWLDLISLKIDSNTRISQNGQAAGIQDLKDGKEVSLAIYDRVTLETESLTLNLPIESGRASR